MEKVVSFGEIMLKVSPLGYQRFLQTKLYQSEYSGAEANVAVSLAQFGIPVSFVSKVPDHDLGEAAINSLRYFGVETNNIFRGAGRLGIYFSEKGASQRPSKVIYDRCNSVFSESEASDYDWNRIFEGSKWFHFTGITPALSDSLAYVCLEACKEAKEKGLTVSCDINYRSKLWSKEKARSVLTKLSPYIDICISNESDICDVFGICASNSDYANGKIDIGSYSVVAKQLVDTYGFKTVAITLRESISASDNIWSAMLFDGERIYNSKKYPIHIVDRIGGGDSFAAGLIYCFLKKYDYQRSLDFSVASSCLKQTIEGDINLTSVAEVEALQNSTGSGRIIR